MTVVIWDDFLQLIFYITPPEHKRNLYAGKSKEKISTISPHSCKSRKTEIGEKLFMDLQPALLNGDGFTLSEIRDAINEQI